MPDLNELLTPAERDLVARLRRPAAALKPDWYRIEAKAGTRTAEVWIYDMIGESFFGEGTTAKSFAGKLAAIDADEIVLHLNSKGGDAFDGVAIYNSLKDHKATVTVKVDGVAASAASLIAQAGDRVVMNRGTQMMIHDAGGIAIGTPNDMREFADVLDKVSDSYASIYAARAGGEIADWRKVMAKDTWYTAEEAVDAGLADEVAADDPPADSDVSKPAARHRAPVTAAQAAAQIHAASQKTPTAGSAAGRPRVTEGAAEMQFTDEERTALRARYQLPDGADDDAIKAALLAPPSDPPAPPAPPANDGSNDPAPATTGKPVQAAGTITIDKAAWDAREETIKRLEAADAKRRRDERDQVIAQAVADGKFPPARKEHWVRLWDADPEGTRQVIDGLARNVVPTAELGYAGDADEADIDAEFGHLFSKGA